MKLHEGATRDDDGCDVPRGLADVAEGADGIEGSEVSAGPRVTVCEREVAGRSCVPRGLADVAEGADEIERSAESAAPRVRA